MMKKSEFKIVPAQKSDAPYIADAVIGAIGHEIAGKFAGSPSRLPLVKEMFTRLASREDSQYSYRNAMVALVPDGQVAGVVVCYDGERLHSLRRAFVQEAHEVLGLDINEEDMVDETSPDEIYLDSLCVFPPYRGLGLGRELIQAAFDAHSASGKPMGLLVDYDNPDARRLYVSLGFEPRGHRPFALVEMEHMVKTS